jgi:hypothetical protein
LRGLILSFNNEVIMEKILQFLPYIIPVVVIELILLVAALLDWLKRPNLSNRWVWLAVILILNLFGPIIYFLFARKDE